MNRSTTDHQIVMVHPALTPSLSVHSHALHVVAIITQPLSRDVHRLATTHVDRNIVEPRRQQQVHRLRDDGIHAQQIPDEPGIHGSRVAVARKPAGLVRVVRIDRLPAPQDGLVLSPLQVIVQERRSERRLVAWIEERGALAVVSSDADAGGAQARSEHGVQAGFRSVGSAHEGYQGLHVEGDGPGVFPRQALVGDARPLAAAARERVVRLDGAVAIDWGEEAGIV